MKNAQAFEQFLVVKYGLQAITTAGYVGSYKRMSAVLGDNPTKEEAEKYIYNLYVSGYSYSHKLNTALAVEKYMEFIGSPVKFGRQKKPRPIIKDTLSEADITKMLFNCNSLREKVIVAVLAYSGLRNLELCNLKVRDVLISQNAIRVICGKGLKDGLSQISPECTKLITRYLNENPRSEDAYLITTLQKGNRMATGDIRKWIKVIARRAKIEKRAFPHLLRHSMTANMLLRGADIISLKNQLRHAWLETTLHYANSIVFLEKNSYQKFCPNYI